MKIIIAILVIAGSSCTGCFAQETLLKRKNLIYGELGGAIVTGVGLGYERYFSIKPSIKVSARTGLGAVDHFASLSTFFGSSIMGGNKSNFEVGLNYLINYDQSTFRLSDDGEAELRNGLQSFVGYRYQNWENGFMFRVFYVLPVGCCGSSIPVYGGASIGYAF